MSPGSARSGGGKGKQKSFCPRYGTKAAASAIPPKLTLLNVHSLTRTIIRAPMDNGWDARRSLLGISAVRSALRSPFAGRSPPRFHHRGLSEGLPRRVLLSVTGFRCLIAVAYYTQERGICQPSFQRKFCHVKSGKHRGCCFSCHPGAGMPFCHLCCSFGAGGPLSGRSKNRWRLSSGGSKWSTRSGAGHVE